MADFTIRGVLDATSVFQGLTKIQRGVRETGARIEALGKGAQQLDRGFGQAQRAVTGLGFRVVAFVAAIRTGVDLLTRMEQSTTKIAADIERWADGFNRSFLSPELRDSLAGAGQASSLLAGITQQQGSAAFGNESGLGQFLSEDSFVRRVASGIGLLPELTGEEEARQRQAVTSENQRQNRVRQRQRDAEQRRVAEETGPDLDGSLRAAFREEQDQQQAAFEEEQKRVATAARRFEIESEILRIEGLRAAGLEREAELAEIALDKRRAIADAIEQGSEAGADPSARIAMIERIASLRAAGLDAPGQADLTAETRTATSVSSGSVGFGGSALIARSLGGGQPEQRTASATERTASLAEQIAATLQTMRLSAPPGGGGAVFAS